MYVLAHQGGWDEILMVLAPIVVIAAMVRLVQRRAERANAAELDESTAVSPGAEGRSGPG